MFQLHAILSLIVLMQLLAGNICLNSKEPMKNNLYSHKYHASQKKHTFMISKRSASDTLHENECFKKNMCKNVGTKIASCSCHTTTCQTYGNCCWDTPIENVVSISPKYANCLSSYSADIFTVDTCPDDYLDREIKIKCKKNLERTLGNSSFADVVPVYSLKTHYTYKNHHCARCHGDFGSHLKYFPIRFVLENNDFAMNSLEGITSIEMNWSQFMYNCSIEFGIPDYPHVHFCTRNLVTHCSSLCQGHQNESVASLCESSGYALIHDGTKTYRNIYCAVCNSCFNEFRCVTFLDRLTYLSQPLSVLLQLNDVGEIPNEREMSKLVCQRTHNLMENCYPVRCRFGYELDLKKMQCSHRILEISNIPFYISAYFYTNILDELHREILRRSHIDLIRDLLETTPFYLKSEKISSVSSYSLTNACEIVMVTYKLYVTWTNSNIQTYIDYLSEKIRSSWQPSVLFKSGITEKEYKAERMSRDDACHKCFGNALENNVCQSSIIRSDSPLFALFSNIYFPKCPYVEYNLDDIDENYQYRFQQLIESYPDDIKHHEGKVYFICYKMFVGFESLLKSNIFLKPGTDVTSIYVTSCVSILSLLITMKKYKAKKCFYESGGLYMIMVSISLLISQILLIASISLVPQSIPCQITGIIFHFSLVYMFVYMCQCAINLFHHFYKSKTINFKDRNLYFKNTMLSIVFSMCFVLPVLAAHFLDIQYLNFRYGNSVCFISTTSGLLVGIYLPLFIMFLVLCICTFPVLFGSNSKSDASLLQSKQKLFLVFITTFHGLLLLPWMFCLFAIWLQKHFWWYFFFTVLSIQGFLISLLAMSGIKYVIWV